MPDDMPKRIWVADAKGTREEWAGHPREGHTIYHRDDVVQELAKVLRTFANVEVPRHVSDYVWVAITQYCNHMITAVQIRRARAALDALDTEDEA